MKKEKKVDDDIIIIDNAVSVQEQIRLEKLIRSEQMTYYYVENSALSSTDEKQLELKKGLEQCGWLKNAFETPQFVHFIWNTDKGLPGLLSPFYPHFASIMAAFPIQYEGIKRIKVNLRYESPNVPENYYGVPHVDMLNSPEQNKIGIYYINDSDGDTVIFNQTEKDWLAKPSLRPPLTVKCRVSPKRGRLVIFPSKYIHSSGINRKTLLRAVVNINLLMPGTLPISK